MVRLAGQSLNSSEAFNTASEMFEEVEFDDLLRTFQDWEDTLSAEKISVDGFLI